MIARPGAAAARPRPRSPYRIMVYSVGAGLWLSGIAWLLLHHMLARQGPFGAEPHPLEPWGLRIHGAFAMAALWTLGIVCAAHVERAWSAGRRRASGAALLSFLVWLILSGYLLYYVGDEEARPLISTLHWVAGGALPLLLVAHRGARKSRAKGR